MSLKRRLKHSSYSSNPTPAITNVLNVLSPLGVFEGNALTGIQYRVEFVVSNFLKLPAEKKIILKSPLFFVGTSNEYQARIICYYSSKCPHVPTHVCRKPHGCTFVQFVFKDGGHIKGLRNVCLSRVGANGSNCIYSGSKPTNTVEGDIFYGVCIAKVPFIFVDGLNDPLRDSCLVLGCDITIDVTVASNEDGNVALEAPIKQVIEDISQLLASGDLSDVSLVVEGGTINAHKAVLGARSPVFRKMFQKDKPETSSNVLRLNDISYEVLQSVVIHMYTGKAPKIGVLGEQILEAAERYELKGLKKCCERKLARSLTVENAARIFLAANKYEAKLLKERSIAFIKDHFNDVVETGGWGEAKKELPLEITVHFL